MHLSGGHLKRFRSSHLKIPPLVKRTCRRLGAPGLRELVLALLLLPLLLTLVATVDSTPPFSDSELPGVRKVARLDFRFVSVFSGNRVGIVSPCLDPKRFIPTVGNPISTGGELSMGNRHFEWSVATQLAALIAQLSHASEQDIILPRDLGNLQVNYCFRSQRAEWKSRFYSNRLTGSLFPAFDWVFGKRLQAVDNQLLLGILRDEFNLKIAREVRSGRSITLNVTNALAPGWASSPESQRAFITTFVRSTNSYLHLAGSLAEFAAAIQPFAGMQVILKRSGTILDPDFDLFIDGKLFTSQVDSTDTDLVRVDSLRRSLAEQLGIACAVTDRSFAAIVVTTNGNELKASNR